MKYSVFSKSVRGYSHELKNIVNQDYVIHKKFNENSFGIVAADGHGTGVCFRSDIGAKIISKLTIDFFENWNNQKISFEAGKFPKIIHALWMHSCMNHLSNNVFNYKELDKLDNKQKNKLRKNALIAYGTTLTAVYKTSDKYYIWKIGDGDVLLLKDKMVVHWEENTVLGEETNSLASTDASCCFESLEIEDIDVNAIMISTDGYSKSFKTKNDFNKTIEDYYYLINSNKEDYIISNLHNWLYETSKFGSGDDISIGVAIKSK